MPGYSRLGPNQARGVPYSGTIGQLQILSAKTQQTWKRVFELPDGGGYTGVARCQALASALNNIFADTTRDADFITPSFVYPADTGTWPNGAYCVVWTKPRSTDTCNTAFLGGGPVVPECLYDGCQFSNCSNTYPHASKASWQDDLIYIRPVEDLIYYADVGWDLALWMANQIRNRIDAVDDRNRALTLLNTSNLHNYTGSSSLTGRFYLAGEEVVNEWTACFAGVETAHTCDLTLATYGSTLDCNMWIRISANGRSVVGRVTDDAQSSGTIEGTSGGIGNALQIGSACNSYPATIGAP